MTPRRLAVTLALALTPALAHGEPPASRAATPGGVPAPAVAAARVSAPASPAATGSGTTTTVTAPLAPVTPAPAAPRPGPVPPPTVDQAASPLIGAPPSMALAAVRVGVALVVVAALLVGGLAGYRWMLAALRPPARGAGAQGRRGWFARWILPGSESDRIDVLARSWVGAKESVCLIRAGSDRFLIGVTQQRVSLLGRMDESGQQARPGERQGTAAAGRSGAVTGTVSTAAVQERAPGAPASPAPVRADAAGAAPGDFARELATARPVEPPAPPRITEDSIRAALAESRQRRARSRGRARAEVHVA